MTTSTLNRAIVVATICLTIAGCGDKTASGTSAQSGGSSWTASNVDLEFGDCSSFRQNTAAFIPEMLKVAQSSARKRHALWAACFDGAPMRTVRWNPKVDFGDLPKELRANDKLADRFNDARALGLKPKLEEMVNTTPERVAGSGQLEALELASKTSNVGRVFMWTDAAVNQVDGIRLADATRGQISHAVARWAPRLEGLRGVQLFFIGVGRGTHDTVGVRNAETLFRELAARVHAGSFSWTVELPADFGSPTA